jgi:toxin ParE1/3/4
VNVRYTAPALADLAAILAYVATLSPLGAARIQRRIQRAIALVSIHPRIGRHTEDPLIRRLNASPYLSHFYEIADSEIIIHAVRHAARNPSGPPTSLQG